MSSRSCVLCHRHIWKLLDEFSLLIGTISGLRMILCLQMWTSAIALNLARYRRRLQVLIFRHLLIQLSVEVRKGLVLVIVRSSALRNIGAAVLAFFLLTVMISLLNLLLHLGIHYHSHWLSGLNLLSQVVVVGLLAARSDYVRLMGSVWLYLAARWQFLVDLPKLGRLVDIAINTSCWGPCGRPRCSTITHSLVFLWFPDLLAWYGSFVCRDSELRNIIGGSLWNHVVVRWFMLVGNLEAMPIVFYHMFL